jgi:hypothetical protein
MGAFRNRSHRYIGSRGLYAAFFGAWVVAANFSEFIVACTRKKLVCVGRDTQWPEELEKGFDKLKGFRRCMGSCRLNKCEMG